MIASPYQLYKWRVTPFGRGQSYTFGEATLVQHTILQRACHAMEMKAAQLLLLDLARRLETEYPSATESVRRLGRRS